MLGVAIIAHIAGNTPHAAPSSAGGVATAALGAGAVALLLHPGGRALVATVAALVLASVWYEAPRLGNHWLLTGLVCVAVLIAVWRSDRWTWFAPTARWILLGFYGFAAFAKLNAGFFDPLTSCGVFYANQWLGSWVLPQVPAGGGLASAVAVASAATELAVPLLLVVPRTRRLGLTVGVVFHALISFDLHQHFYDFTAVLFALFGLFLPDPETTELDRRAGVSRMLPIAAVGAAAVVVLAIAQPTPMIRALLVLGVFALWIPFAAWFVAAVLRRERDEAPVALRLTDPLAIALVIVVVCNGLTPYLELKTAYGFNMYANLHTAAGESNHLLIRRTLPLTDVQEHLVVIEASNDPELARYVDSGYVLPERNLADYLASRPDTSVTFTRDGALVRVTGAEYGRPLSPLIARLTAFRAVDTHDPPRCQVEWLPAR